MGRFKLYAKPGSDDDLISLYEQLGTKEFNELVRDSLRVLTRPGYKAKSIVPNQLEPFDLDTQCLEIYVSITSQKDEDIDTLLSHVKKNSVQKFIKLSIRYFIGATHALNVLLDDEVSIVAPVYINSAALCILPSSNTKRVKEKKITTKARRANEEKKEIKTPTVDIRGESPIAVKETNDAVLKAEDFGFSECEETNEDDVLALLEGLI